MGKTLASGSKPNSLRSQHGVSHKMGGFQTFAASARWECVNSES
jgi:hypothetical protein